MSLLEIQPAPITDASIRGSAYLAAKAAFPPDKLTDLYLRQRISTADIAEQIGVDSTVIALLARDYQIPDRKPGRPLTTNVDRDWFHEQYITLGRSLTDLAHETGNAWISMARWAERQNIPLRRRHGFDSRRIQFSAAEIAAAPPILQPALVKTGGLGLLNDFAATTSHPTIIGAAQSIGIHWKTLANRIKELEQHLGGTLLNRTSSHRLPMALTPLGHAVLDAINRFKR